jgi:RHS repeat-associated protein
MGFSTQKFFPEHQPKAALSTQLWHEKTASGKFFDQTKIVSEKSPAKPTTARKKSDRTYETATEVIYEHYRYTAFGEPEIYDSSGNKLATSAIKNEILWNSRRYDSTTNLYYYKYRHYAPTIGRWLGRDTIAEKGGYNLYNFVGNEPIGRWDKFGLEVGGGDVIQEVADEYRHDSHIQHVSAKGLGSMSVRYIAARGKPVNGSIESVAGMSGRFGQPFDGAWGSAKWDKSLGWVSDMTVSSHSIFTDANVCNTVATCGTFGISDKNAGSVHVQALVGGCKNGGWYRFIFEYRLAWQHSGPNWVSKDVEGYASGSVKIQPVGGQGYSNSFTGAGGAKKSHFTGTILQARVYMKPNEWYNIVDSMLTIVSKRGSQKNKHSINVVQATKLRGIVYEGK